MNRIKIALISVYYKDGLLPILLELKRLKVRIISTGGSFDYILSEGFEVEKVEDMTGYPSIFGGRVKTLHPKIFGGILARRNNKDDQNEKDKYDIPLIDLVIVDLYPFTETVNNNAREEEIIEKIDIGGISLIRAAAKNYEDVLIIPSKNQYSFLLDIITRKDGYIDINDRKLMATQAFGVSSSYDLAIFDYFSNGTNEALKASFGNSIKLRYGENPHQDGHFYGNLEKVFFQHHGKQISYNNLLDMDAALKLIIDFDKNTFAVIKHNNPCGLATRDNLIDAWKDALAGDPVSAFGGIIATKAIIEANVASEINKLFFEVILATGYSTDALEILKQKKNRIILQIDEDNLPLEDIRTAINGLLVQDRDIKIETEADFKYVTNVRPDKSAIDDLLFANKIVKHVKSNAIVLIKNKQLVGTGMGQPNRIDAVRQAIEKAGRFNFDIQGAVMASDAFFPFKDTVEIAHNAGIMAIIQPGGSIRDQESIDYCNENKLAMVFTGFRHFKH